MSLVRRYSPSGLPSSSISWKTKICVYVKLSRSLRNSSSCSVNFWMICSTGIAGGSLVICEDVNCREEFVFADSTGAGDGATVPGGGGGNGPCRCAAVGSASKVHAITKSVMTPKFLRSFIAIVEMTARILSGLLTLFHSLLYLKI